MVAAVIFAQQHQVVVGRLHPFCFFKPGAGRYINLAANNRLNAVLQGLFVKFKGAVHYPVVGYCNGGLPGGLYRQK